MYTERLLSMFTLLLMVGLIVFEMNRCRRQGVVPAIRPIAALDAVPELVGRCAEMNRFVHFGFGTGDILGADAPQVFAGIQMMGYVAELCARYDVKLIATVRHPLLYPIVVEMAQQAYRRADRIDAFTEDTVQFLSSDQFAYCAGVIGLMQRYRVGGNLLIGQIVAEAIILCETAFHLGAIQISGTPNILQVPSLIVTNDYVLLGDEMYTAGAYVSKEPARLGCVRGQDHSKALSALLLVVGALLTTAKVKALTDFISKYGK